jgi:O-antigen ligase
VVIALRRDDGSTALALHRGTIGRIALLVAWLGLTAIWATDGGLVVHELWIWALALFAFTAIVLTCTERRRVLWLVTGLVVGATGSAALGLFGDSLGIDPASFAGGETHGRLAGGAGDANQLAAGLVPAIALAIGLAICARRPLLRLLALATVPLSVVGIAASESRGGFIAAIALVGLMFALFRGARGTIALSTVLATAAGALYFASSPSSWHRISDLNGDGTGRTELWRIALRMSDGHPLGVGLNNFRALARDYALDVGNLQHVHFIVERPVVAHNTYLQLLAETGIVGVVLFQAVIVASFAAAFRAARLFDATGDSRMAMLARAAIAALGAFLVAAFFVSFGSSYRLWALLALGPALLTVAERRVSRGWS